MKLNSKSLINLIMNQRSRKLMMIHKSLHCREEMLISEFLPSLFTNGDKRKENIVQYCVGSITNGQLNYASQNKDRPTAKETLH